MKKREFDVFAVVAVFYAEASYYLNSSPPSVWYKPDSIVTVWQRVRLDPLVSIISTLGSDSLDPCNHAQVNL